jgi:hypothetical protein
MRKLEKEKTGPGQYDMLKIFDRNRVKPCTRIVKPELLDEQLYEIVGGTVKVCKPSLMDGKSRALHDLAINNFFRNGTTTQKVKKDISDTYIHQQSFRKPWLTAKTTEVEQDPIELMHCNKRISERLNRTQDFKSSMQ